jgi:glutamate-1-semialdehyde aminotransferase
MDEAHTVQMAYGGLCREWRLEPDMITYGKGFGCGYPIGAYGMREPIARLIEKDIDLFLASRRGIALGGTLFGTAMGFAAVRATLETVLTPAAYADAARLGVRLADGIDRAIARHGIPWRAQRLNARSGISLFPENPRNGAEGARSMDVDLIDARRVYMANRGIWDAIYSAGPQAGFAQSDTDVDHYVAVFDAFLGEIV